MEDIRAFGLVKELMEKNEKFCMLVKKGLADGTIRYFGEEEWKKINKQNYIGPTAELNEFYDLFLLGYNIGNCAGTARQLSYSYNNVDIVSGTVELLKGTLNAEKEGGHCWLENDAHIIDTSLMLIIDKKLKSDIGYIEEQRVTQNMLRRNYIYMLRKEFVNDDSISCGKRH